MMLAQLQEPWQDILTPKSKHPPFQLMPTHDDCFHFNKETQSQTLCPTAADETRLSDSTDRKHQRHSSYGEREGL